MKSKENSGQKAAKKPTITQQLAQAVETMNKLIEENKAMALKLTNREALEKANEELREQLKKMLEPKKEVKLDPNELFLEIRYDKEGKGEVTTKNYWGKLVNATIQGDRRYFQLLGNDGQYRMFNKEKCVNKEEVTVAVEKLMALRNAIR